jgi:AcrR family transcriptional regulator
MLFAERGFDNVSVTDVAEAAGVSKMTVFNYFPRKEDLFFDRAPEFAARLTTTIRSRGPEVGPVAAIRDMVLKLLDEQSPLAGFGDTVPHFWRVVIDSPALRARAREGVDELEGLLATLIAETRPTQDAAPEQQAPEQQAPEQRTAEQRTPEEQAAGAQPTGGQVAAVRVAEDQARLTAALLMAAWRTAYLSGARRIMAGERTADFFAEQRAWTAECLSAVPEPPLLPAEI